MLWCHQLWGQFSSLRSIRNIFIINLSSKSKIFLRAASISAAALRMWTCVFTQTGALIQINRWLNVDSFSPLLMVLHVKRLFHGLWCWWRNKPSSTCGQSLTESVGVEGQTLELQEVPNCSRKDLDLVSRQIHSPQVTGEPLQLLWKLKRHQHQETSETELWNWNSWNTWSSELRTLKDRANRRSADSSQSFAESRRLLSLASYLSDLSPPFTLCAVLSLYTE